MLLRAPEFFSIYVDDLVGILKQLGIGCHLRNIFLSVLLYADDMALVSPSLRGLQTLLKACEDYCSKWDICLNTKKTKNLAFGSSITNLCPLFLNGNEIEWVSEWKYLGLTLQSHNFFNCVIDERIRSFYRCLNAILRIEGRSNELVMLRLLEAHCLPILTYAIEVVHVADPDIRRKFRVAYNAIFRKIFYYRYTESVRELQQFLSRPTWEELVERRQAKFRKKLDIHPIACALL